MKIFSPIACYLLSFLTLITSANSAESAGIEIEPTFPTVGEKRKPDRVLPSVQTSQDTVIIYTPEGRLLATGGGDKTIKLWDARTGEQGTGELVRTLEGHTDRIVAIGFSADGKSLISAAQDQTVRTWDFTTGKLLGTFAVKFGHTGPVKTRPGPEPQLVDVADNQIRLWNYQRGEIERTLEAASAKVRSLAFRPDGKWLVGATEQGAIHLWEVESGKLVRTIETKTAIHAVAASATHLAAGCADGTVKIWPLETPAPARDLRGHSGASSAVAFSAKGEQLGSAGADRTVKVWDVESGALLCSQEGHTREVLSVVFNSNGQKMASGGADRSVCYWTVPLPPVPPADLEKIRAALPTKATVTPKKARRVLVFWRADAILHKSGVPAANQAIELMGEKTGAFTADFSRDYDVFQPAVLAKYDAIVMNSTAHISFPESAKQAYLEFAKSGRGVVGIHAAIDMFRDWPEGAKVIGATFGNHPWGPSGTWAVKLEEPDHPLLRAFGGKNFKIRDEFYEMWDPFTRADRRVLLSVDLSDEATAGVKGLRRPDRDFVLAWIKRYGEGRVFYCDFGHIGEPFQNPAVLQFYLDGIQYALGDLEADATPRPPKTP